MYRLLSALLLVSVVSFTSDDLSGLHTDPEVDYPSLLDSLDYIDLEALGVSNYCKGVGYDTDGRFWVTDAASQAGDTNRIHIISLNGTLITTVKQKETTGLGLYDLCWDGTYMFGSSSNEVQFYDGWYYYVDSYYCYACSPNRAQAIDNWGYRYTGNLSNVVYQVDWDGVFGSTASYTVWSTAIANGGVSGAAYDSYTDCLWVTTASGDNLIYQLDMDGSLIYEHTYDIESADGCTTGSLYGSRRANIGETLSLPVISVDGRGGLLDESTAVQERAGG